MIKSMINLYDADYDQTAEISSRRIACALAFFAKVSLLINRNCRVEFVTLSK